MHVRQNQITVSLPVLTQVGEYFKLPEAKFGKGAVGRVLELIGQHQGHTRVLMQILSSEEATKALSPPEEDQKQAPVPVPPAQYLPRSSRKRNRRQERQDALHAQAQFQAEVHKKAQLAQQEVVSSEAESPLVQQNFQWDPMAFSTPRERFQAGVEQVVQKGGDPRNATGLDTIPRSGPQNKPIFNSALDAPGRPNQQQQIINKLIPKQGRNRRGGRQNQNALAGLDGNSVQEPATGRRGGYRRSEYQGKYQWDPQTERLVSQNPSSLPARPRPPAEQSVNMPLPPKDQGYSK